MNLLNYVPRTLSAFVPQASRALRASFHTFSRVSHVLRALLNHLSCAFHVLGLLIPRTLRDLVRIVPHLLQVFYACHALTLLMRCSFHALCLLGFRSFSYLSFLKDDLR